MIVSIKERTYLLQDRMIPTYTVGAILECNGGSCMEIIGQLVAGNNFDYGGRFWPRSFLSLCRNRLSGAIPYNTFTRLYCYTTVYFSISKADVKSIKAEDSDTGVSGTMAFCDGKLYGALRSDQDYLIDYVNVNDTTVQYMYPLQQNPSSLCKKKTI